VKFQEEKGRKERGIENIKVYIIQERIDNANN